MTVREFFIDGILIRWHCEEEPAEGELQAYAAHAREKYPTADIAEMDIRFEKNEDGTEDALIDYTFSRAWKFQRLRRITGYLVGSLDRWNNGKRAEEHDRVKHNASEVSK